MGEQEGLPRQREQLTLDLAATAKGYSTKLHFWDKPSLFKKFAPAAGVGSANQLLGNHAQRKVEERFPYLSVD